ncbi:MAG: HAD family hydrolase [Evtepia gabavorous]
MPGEIDKGEALRYLLDRLDIAPEEVLAMGDGGSDLPLLQAAGIGVAMGNATEAVKAGADFVTASCEEPTACPGH